MATYQTLEVRSKQLYPNFSEALKTWQSTQPRVDAGTTNGGYIAQAQSAVIKLEKSIADAIKLASDIDAAINETTAGLEDNSSVLTRVTQVDTKLEKESPELQYSLDTAVGLYGDERQKYLLSIVETILYLVAIGIAFGNVYRPKYVNIGQLLERLEKRIGGWTKSSGTHLLTALKSSLKFGISSLKFGISYAINNLDLVYQLGVEYGEQAFSEN